MCFGQASFQTTLTVCFHRDIVRVKQTCNTSNSWILQAFLFSLKPLSLFFYVNVGNNDAGIRYNASSTFRPKASPRCALVRFAPAYCARGCPLYGFDCVVHLLVAQQPLRHCCWTQDWKRKVLICTIQYERRILLILKKVITNIQMCRVKKAQNVLQVARGFFAVIGATKSWSPNMITSSLHHWS